MTTPYEGAATAAQLASLKVFHELTSHAEGRQKWLTAPPGLKEQVFNESRSQGSEAAYTDIPPKIRALLESLSDSELALLSDINATYVGAGVTFPNVPMMAH